MKEKRRKLLPVLLCLALGVGCWGLSLQDVMAESDSEENEEIQVIEFNTEYEVTAAADGYFIVKDSATGKYGLLDEEGEEAIECKYDEMEFPEDSTEYDYVLVKENADFGILSYKGDTIIDTDYSSIDPYRDGNTVAAAYNGNKTDLYNIKGKQIGELSGEYTVVSDDVFMGESDLKSDKDGEILNFQQKGLLFTDKNDDQVAYVEKIGNNLAADYNLSSGKDQSEKQYGQLNTYRYVKIFEENGEEKLSITPEESWTEDEEETVEGGIRIKEVVSDHSLIVQLVGEDDYKYNNYLTIYDIQEEKFSPLYVNIGTFYDGKAFAADEDENLLLIDENGEEISEEAITVDEFDRLELKKYQEDPFAMFKKTEGEEVQYKLYSLKNNQSLDAVFCSVDFQKDEEDEEICQGMPLVSNEDGEYTILNQEGEPIFDYGQFQKEDLVDNTLYSDSCVCVTVQEGAEYGVHAYIIDQGDENSFLNTLKEKLKNPLMLAVIAAIILLLLLITVILILLKKRSRERKAQQRTEERRKQFQEKAQRQRGRKDFQKPGDSHHNRFADRSPSEEVDKTTRITPPDVIQQPNQSGNQSPISFYGALECLTGEYAGARIALSENEWIRVGRDEGDNDLIIKNSKVSRKHCAISYDPLMRKYLIIDYSRNGVFLQDGSKLIQNQKSLVREGTKIYLGNDQTVIKLLGRTNS